MYKITSQKTNNDNFNFFKLKKLSAGQVNNFFYVINTFFELETFNDFDIELRLILLFNVYFRLWWWGMEPVFDEITVKIC